MIARYRGVLGLAGVAPTMLVMLFARLPQTAAGITLTLHVVRDLGHGFGAAGTVGAIVTVGVAIGSPAVGRLVDRVGLRPVVLLCGAASVTFWMFAPTFGYPVLLLAALPMGLLVLPASSLARQVLAAQVPAERRRTAYSLDSMAVEIGFMIGPAAGVFVSTQFSGSTALRMVGVAFGLAALALWLLDPPVRSAAETGARAARPPIRSWLSPRLAATLLVASGALFVLIGMELAMIAALRANGELTWTGVVMVVICLASVLGGLLHGALPRSLGQVPLAVLLAVLVMPVGLLDVPWWLLAALLVPSNLACAPTIAATAEVVSARSPVPVRGEAMGLQSSAMMAGIAVGSPAVGFVVDHLGPGAGFAAAGLGGLVLTVAAALLSRAQVWGKRSMGTRTGEGARQGGNPWQDQSAEERAPCTRSSARSSTS